MATDATNEARAGIGVRLRAGREKIGLTILQAAERLHVDARILEALEAENFDALGAPVYARGHLRNYAELVGESAAELSGLYSSSSRTGQQPDLTRIAKAPPSTESNRLILPALIMLSVFAVAGAVWWVLSLSGKRPQRPQANVIATVPADAGSPQTNGGTPTSPTSPTAQTSSAARPVPAPASVSGTSPGPTAGSASNSTPGATPGSASGAAPSSVQRGNSAVAPGVASAAAGAGAVSGGAGAARGDSPADNTARSAHETQIILRYTADSWTEVYDSTGQRLFYDVGTGNSVRTLKGSAPLRVVLGNASGVSLAVNGHDAPVSKFAQPDGSAQFFVSRSGRVSRAKSAKTGG